MELLQDVLSLSLAVVIQLGLPVAILFVGGQLIYRSDQGPRHGSRGRQESGRGAVGMVAGGRPSGAGEEVRCWMVKGCSPEAREGCAASVRGDLPCWEAAKLALGRLRGECVDCELFLAPRPVDVSGTHPAVSRKPAEPFKDASRSREGGVGIVRKKGGDGKWVLRP